MTEFAIEWIKGADTATITTPASTKMCNSLKGYAVSHPGEVQITYENKDGSMVAHVPVRWVKVRPPRKVSEEQRVRAAERLAKARATKG